MGIINIFVTTNSRPGDGIGSANFKDDGLNSRRIKITPVRHLYQVLLIRLFRKSSAVPREKLLELSKGANVRCLDCGWKYNLHSITQCPLCTSERTYLLSNGSFLASIATISFIVTAFCGLIVIAYRTITG